MANITVPINVNLPDDWIEQIVNRLRNDPDADWAEVIRCRDCKYNRNPPSAGNALCDQFYGMTDQDGFCHMGERRTDET